MADTATATTTETPAWKIEADQRTKELTEKLEAGINDLFSSDKYTDYLKSMSKFHNYSSRNIMLIHQQMPGATHVASFKLWGEQFNRQVKKGEKSLRIYAPIGSKKEDKKMMEKLDPETGAPMLDTNGKVIMEEMTALKTEVRFKLVPVFDVSQTAGDPLPQLAEDLTGNVEHYEAFLDTLKAVSPLPIEFEPMKPEQDGYCRYGEKIGIREGMSEIQTVSAIIHEITHARLHDRDLTAKDAPAKSKEVKEIEAESVSYVVCQKYGIETGDNAFGYLASWGSHDLAEFKASLDTIRKEANNLINAVDDRFAIICKERGIDLTAAAEQIPPQQAQATEPEYTTESTTQNIAEVDFSFEEVKPVTREHKNFQQLTELFPQVASGEFNYQRMEAGAAMMPLSLEWISENQLSIMHTYTQNGDLMYDPMMVFEIDPVAKTAAPVEFQMSNPPLYQVVDEKGVGHSIDGNGNERRNYNLQAELNDFSAQFFSNIGQQNYKPVLASLRDEEYDDSAVYFNADQKPYNLAFVNDSEGTTILNNLDKGDDGNLAKVAHVDSFRNIEFFEENLPKDVVMIIEEVKLTNERTADEKQADATADTPPFTQTEPPVPPPPDEPPQAQESDEPMPDPSINRADMKDYGYDHEGMFPLNQDRAVDLFNQDHAIFLLYNDGTEAMVYDSSEIIAHNGIFGIEREDWEKTQEYRDLTKAIEPPKGQGIEAKQEADFLNSKEDAFAIYQIMDDRDFSRDYRFEGLDYLEERGWEVNRNHYVLVHTDALTPEMTLEDIYQKYNDPPKNFSGHSLSVSDVVVLNKGGEITSHFVDRVGFAELPSFLGVEKQQEQATPVMAQTDTVKDLPPSEPITPDIPEIPKKDQPIYKQSSKVALQNSEIDAFHVSRKLNVECGKAIDNAIIASNYEQYRYDLKTAARDVLNEFGADRVAWVVASNVNRYDYDGRLSKDNKEWAKGFETPEPDIYLQTHLTVLDGFVSRFREVEKEKPSLMSALKVSEEKSRKEFGNLQSGKDAPKKSTKKTGEEL
jgi:hypothetical protein